MSAPSYGNAAEELGALRLRYARSLPGRLGHLREALRAWGRAPGDGARLVQAEALAHRLRGSSGSYGFGALSQKLGAVEDALRGFRVAGAPPREAMAAVEPDLREADGLALAAIAELGSASAET